jgi:anti-sigma-K factor RskA
MNYRNPQLLDELAAQYVIGTLRGRARKRFHDICQRQSEAMSALHRWEDRLLGLMNEVKPVKPPTRVWQDIQRRLGHGRERIGLFETFLAWRGRSRLALAAGIAAIALSVAVVTYISIPQTQLMATIQNEQQAEQWRVEASKDRAKLSISRSATLALESNRDYELWALPDSGSAPVSLGLMPKRGKRELQLSVAQRLALAGASKIAVSLEPIGGSQTGAPTGPVLFVANVSGA